jgi:UDPglucose--hexose-1-phosphate uridylyltransferase
MAEPRRAALADGRDILYFDEQPRPAPPADRRELPPRPEPAELRFDPLLRQWVSFAAHRQSRTHLPPADECPLCPSGSGRATEVPAGDYDVVVFENRFPSFGPGVPGRDISPPDFWERRPAGGRCEVLVFASGHTQSLGRLSDARVATIIDAWAHRTAELSALPGVEQVFAFENRGAEIGVTLHHPHGQLYAYPYVPERIRTHLAAAVEHRDRTGRNLFADVLDSELRAGARVVHAGEHWVVLVPHAARMPIEAHLVPRRHVPDLAALEPAERGELAAVLPALLRAVDGLYASPTPYIAAWYQAPVRAEGRGEYRLHLQLSSPRRAEDKLKYLAGSEAAMGAFIADILPEETAERLRAAFDRARRG